MLILLLLLTQMWRSLQNTVRFRPFFPIPQPCLFESLFASASGPSLPPYHRPEVATGEMRSDEPANYPCPFKEQRHGVVSASKTTMSSVVRKETEFGLRGAGLFGLRIMKRRDYHEMIGKWTKAREDSRHIRNRQGGMSGEQKEFGSGESLMSLGPAGRGEMKWRGIKGWCEGICVVLTLEKVLRGEDNFIRRTSSVELFFLMDIAVVLSFLPAGNPSKRFSGI